MGMGRVRVDIGSQEQQERDGPAFLPSAYCYLRRSSPWVSRGSLLELESETKHHVKRGSLKGKDLWDSQEMEWGVGTAKAVTGALFQNWR